MFEYHGWATLRLTPGHEEVPDELLKRFAEELRDTIAERFGTGSGTHEVRAVNSQHYVWVEGAPNHRHEQIFALFPYIAARAPGSYGLLYVWDDEHPLHSNSFRVWRLARGRVDELPDSLFSPCVPVLEDEYRDEDDIPRLERDTAEFTAVRNVEVFGLRVLNVTRDAFLQHARHHGLLDCALDAEGSVTIARTFTGSREKQALLARAFLDLWHCGKFSADVWDPLIDLEPALAGLAVEACYYVFAMSGANGATDLRGLLMAHGRTDAIDAAGFARFDDNARRWLRSVMRVHAG